MSAIEQQLVKIKREAEERDAKRKSEENNLPYLNLVDQPVSADALKLLNKEEAEEAKVAPVDIIGKDLKLAVFNVKDSKVQEVVNKLKDESYNVSLYQVSQSSLDQAWSAYKFIPQERSAITGRVDIEAGRLEELSKELVDKEAVKGAISTSEVLEVILAGAIGNRASDIHFEPEAEAVKIRYRIDGLLNDIITNFSPSIYKTLLTRIKLLAGLKLDSQSPQDGRFSVGLGDKGVELRVSVVPSEFGETVVIRVLDPNIINIPLSELGLREDDLEIILSEIKEPNGMILNTGPTGSGKTTTLYGFLKERQSPEIKIITIEDPIEYNLEGVEQTQVNPGKGYDFANGLSSVMRQDPDIILVGEIRDGNTAGIAIQAALTGHLVFSTVHANGAAGAISRLLDLDVKPTSIGPALNLIMAQRLVRRLCSDCKKEKEIDTELQVKIKEFLNKLPERINKEKYAAPTLYEPVGCSRCDDKGYKGRIGIFELLKVGEEIETLIEKQVSETELQDFAVNPPDGGGMVTVQQDGILKVLSGITTLEEVEAATGHLKI